MKLSTSNTNANIAIYASNGVLSNTAYVGSNSIIIGTNNIINNSQLTVGSVLINSTSISTPSLLIGGFAAGSPYNGIVNAQFFTANGTWLKPDPVSTDNGLTYTWYSQGTTTNPADEAGMTALFNTNTVSPTVTFGGTGIHSGKINWGDSGQTGAGGVTTTKPAYLPTSTFSWQVEGYILAPETGTYTFGVDGDDACDLFVNGVNVANYYGGHGFASAWSGSGHVAGTISLIAGQYYPFKARMQDGFSLNGFQVGWQKPSDGSLSLIPASALFKTNTGIAGPSLSGNAQVLIMMWGGGGGGSANGTTQQAGGGGGACFVSILPLSSLSTTCAVTVGANGSSGTAGAAGGAGGNSSFVINATSTIVACGGGGARANGPLQFAGGGGGLYGNGAIGGSGVGGLGGGPLGGAPAAAGDSTFGGGGGGQGSGSAAAGRSIFGGGAGNWGGTNFGGLSIYGGGGGGSAVGGTSVFGGNGGTNTTAASIPGGGGSANNVTPAAAARGEVRVWVIG